jgi:hypothetical protein
MQPSSQREDILFRESNKLKLSKKSGHTSNIEELIAKSDIEILEHLRDIKGIIRNLQEDLVVICHYRVFSINKIRKIENKQLLSNYGTDDVVNLRNYYADIALRRGKDSFITSKVVNEWETFKVFINTYNSSATVKDLLIFLSPDLQEDSALAIRKNFGQVSRLVDIFYLLPLTTVDCERGFSKQNIIKTKQRNGLATERLASLMHISINGQTEYLQEEDLHICFLNWKNAKKRMFV